MEAMLKRLQFGPGYAVRAQVGDLELLYTRSNPGWGGAMGTLRRPGAPTEWRYFRDLEGALADPVFGPLARVGWEAFERAREEEGGGGCA